MIPRPSGVPLLLVAILLGGCAQLRRDDDRAFVNGSLTERTGHGVAPAAASAEDSHPPAVSEADGLSEDEAVAIALWRNAEYQAELARLRVGAADVMQARQIPNPDLQVLFPVGPKQAEYTASIPLDWIWLRPKRVALAKLGLEAMAERLVQSGLDLARDVRLAYADLWLKRNHAALLEESARLQVRVADLADARVRAGDAAPLDAAAARIEALRTAEEAARMAHEVAIAEVRLGTLLAMEGGRATAAVTLDPPASVQAEEEARLVADALDGRPDVRAAQLAWQAARRRSALARGELFVVSGIADANAEGSEGFEAGPGVKLSIPLLNWNQAAVTRAEAEAEVGKRAVTAMQHRIAGEVREGLQRIRQARESYVAWSREIAPRVSEAVARAEGAYKAGATPLVLVLEMNRQLLEARLREAQAVADHHRARAELERSVGRRLRTAAPTTDRVEPDQERRS